MSVIASGLYSACSKLSVIGRSGGTPGRNVRLKWPDESEVAFASNKLPVARIFAFAMGDCFLGSVSFLRTAPITEIVLMGDRRSHFFKIGTATATAPRTIRITAMREKPFRP